MIWLSLKILETIQLSECSVLPLSLSEHGCVACDGSLFFSVPPVSDGSHRANWRERLSAKVRERQINFKFTLTKYLLGMGIVYVWSVLNSWRRPRGRMTFSMTLCVMRGDDVVTKWNFLADNEQQWLGVRPRHSPSSHQARLSAATNGSHTGRGHRCTDQPVITRHYVTWVTSI